MKKFEYKLGKILKKQTGGQTGQDNHKKPKYSVKRAILIDDTLHFDIINEHNCAETLPPADVKVNFNTFNLKQDILNLTVYLGDNLPKEQFAFHKSEYYAVRNYARQEFYARNIKNYEIYGFTADNIELENSPMRYVPQGQHVEISI